MMLQSPALRMRCLSGVATGTPRGFMPWGSPGASGEAARMQEWWVPAGASGWTPVAAAMRSAAARSTPPFLRDRLGADAEAAEDVASAAARWASVSSASTQVFQSADASDFERVLLHGCANPLPDGDEPDERCVSAALALTLVRSAPKSPLAPLALNAQPCAKEAKASGPAPPAVQAGRAGKRSRAEAAAPLPAAPCPAAAAESVPEQAAPPRSSSGRRSAPGVCSWTKEEDSALLRLTQVYGERSWAGVAAALGCGRSGKQVRERYMYIKPGQNTGPWTEEEDCQLQAHHARLGNRWAEIARLMHRPDNMVKNRHYGRQKAALKKAGALQVMPCEPEDVCDAPGAVL